jgi:phage terminase large subunit GpA-like protein
MTAEEKFIRAFEAFRLVVPVDCLTWAQRELFLTKRVSPEPGPYRIDSRPYVRGVLDALQDGKTRTIVLCWGTQTGKTLTLGVWQSYRIANDPAPGLIVMPSESQARSYSETRLRPLFDSAPSVRAKYPSDRDKLKLLEMHFIDSTLNLSGSNSPAEVSSRPVEILICDEVDKFATASATESGALHLALERTKAFPRAKHVLASTPTVPYGDIWHHFLRGTQERFHIRCPACGQFHYMDFRRDVRWDQEARFPSGQWDLRAVAESARWACPDCGNLMISAEKIRAMQAGEWRACNATAEPGVRSFHLNSLYSPAVTFAQAAVKFLSAQDPAAIQNFANGWLAEPHEERGTGADDDDVLTCRGIYQRGVCPIEPEFVSICADPGQTQTHWSACAWTLEGEGYVIDYGRLLSPEDLLSLAAERRWQTPSGSVVQCDWALIDSGDFTERV